MNTSMECRQHVRTASARSRTCGVNGQRRERTPQRHHRNGSCFDEDRAAQPAAEHQTVERSTQTQWPNGKEGLFLFRCLTRRRTIKALVVLSEHAQSHPRTVLSTRLAPSIQRKELQAVRVRGLTTSRRCGQRPARLNDMAF